MDVDIQSSQWNISIGGFIGYNEGYHVPATIKDCYSLGNVHVREAPPLSHIGGFIGRSSGIYNSDLRYYSYIENCYSAGNIIIERAGSTMRIGGFIGCIAGDEIKNCFTTGGIIITRSGLYGSIGGLVGIIGYDNFLIKDTNCYKYIDQIVYYASNELGEICTHGDLNDVEFYTNTLEWDSYIWNLTKLDFANNKYPILYFES